MIGVRRTGLAWCGNGYQQVSPTPGRTFNQEANVRVGSVILVLWLIIGVIAAAQRGYFKGDDTNCAKTSNTIITIVAGPLNYVGVNPKVDCNPEVPQPSQ